MRKFIPLCLTGCAATWAAEPTDLDFAVASSLPSELVEYLRVTSGHQSYALSSWLNPYYLQADFNGDGRADIAVLVREKATNKLGVLIVHVGAGHHVVLGAGNPLGNGETISRGWMLGIRAFAEASSNASTKKAVHPYSAMP